MWCHMTSTAYRHSGSWRKLFLLLLNKISIFIWKGTMKLLGFLFIYLLFFFFLLRLSFQWPIFQGWIYISHDSLFEYIEGEFSCLLEQIFWIKNIHISGVLPIHSIGFLSLRKDDLSSYQWNSFMGNSIVEGGRTRTVFNNSPGIPIRAQIEGVIVSPSSGSGIFHA